MRDEMPGEVEDSILFLKGILVLHRRPPGGLEDWRAGI